MLKIENLEVTTDNKKILKNFKKICILGESFPEFLYLYR